MTESQPRAAIPCGRTSKGSEQYQLTPPMSDVEYVTTTSLQVGRTSRLIIHAGTPDSPYAIQLAEVETYHEGFIPPIAAADILRAWGYEVAA